MTIGKSICRVSKETLIAVRDVIDGMIEDYREYEYTGGVSEQGTGEPLEDFIAFQIKIVMQGTNSARPPRLRDFRAIAMVS